MVRGQTGILVWWLLLLAVGFGLLPLVRPSRLAVISSLALIAFVGWMALGLLWTESTEGTMDDVGRVAAIAGFFLAAIALRPARGVPRVIDGVAASVGAVCVIALASRLFPGLFSGAGDTALLVDASEGRLSFPVDYWNGLAALAAVGLAPLLSLATEPGNRVVRSVAAGLISVVGLAVFLTYSRTGIAACLLALLVFLLLAGRFFQRSMSLLLVLAGAGILIGLSAVTPDFADGVRSATLTGVPSPGIVLAVVFVMLAVGAGQWFLVGIDDRLGQVTWKPDKRNAAIAGGIVLALVVGLFFAGSGPSRVSDAWREFESPGEVQKSGAGRLASFGGNNRAQYWRAAIDQFESEPLRGRGSGTFELWSNRSEGTEGFVRDAHSLYLETLGELGLVGALLLIAFVLMVLAGGTGLVLRGSPAVRPRLAAALAGSAAFFTTAALDWTWELTVVPVAAFLLAGTLLTGLPDNQRRRGPQASPALRLGVIVVAIAAIVVIWLPYSRERLMEESRSEAAQGNLAGAWKAASAAADVVPKSMGPVLQQALLLDENGDTALAVIKATEAATIEPANWRPWFVRSYLEARLGLEKESRRSFREARRLNPDSYLFADGYPEKG